LRSSQRRRGKDPSHHSGLRASSRATFNLVLFEQLPHSSRRARCDHHNNFAVLIDADRTLSAPAPTNVRWQHVCHPTRESAQRRNRDGPNSCRVAAGSSKPCRCKSYRHGHIRGRALPSWPLGTARCAHCRGQRCQRSRIQRDRGASAQPGRTQEGSATRPQAWERKPTAKAVLHRVMARPGRCVGAAGRRSRCVRATWAGAFEQFVSKCF
jgi:hypothetical protein